MRPLTQVMAVLGAGLLFEAFLRAHRELRESRQLRLIGLDEFIAEQRARRAAAAEAAGVAKPS